MAVNNQSDINKAALQELAAKTPGLSYADQAKFLKDGKIGDTVRSGLSIADQEKFLKDGKISVDAVKQGGADVYRVTSTDPTTGVSKSVNVPQTSGDWQMGLKTAEQVEADNRATALAAYKEAHPELPPLKATAAFNAEVQKGTVTYEKPAQAFEQTRPPTESVPVVVPPADRTVTVGESITRSDPQVERAPKDVNIDGKPLPPSNTPSTRAIEAESKIAETRALRDQEQSQARALRNEANEAEEKSLEAENKRAEEQFRADSLKEDAGRLEQQAADLESSNPTEAARLREQAAGLKQSAEEAEDNAYELAQDRDSLEADAKNLSSAAREKDANATVLEQDVISAEAEKNALAEDAALAAGDVTNEEVERLNESGTTDDNAVDEGEAVPPAADQDDAGLGTPSPSEASKVEVGAEQSQKTKIEPIPNPLHDYSSYTYGLALHMLSAADYKAMATDPDGGWVPSKTLIASAGKYGGVGSGFERDPRFREDFYFDNFKMNTVVGLNSGSQGSNAIDIGFTIIEPYGMTLIDRFMNACEELDGKNYLEVPYLIQIDFYGYDDEGTQRNIIEHRKFIPVKLIEMKIRVGVKGAEYQVKAVPFTHGGFFESVAATPANFEVTASTLLNFFDAGADESKTIQTMQQRKEAAAKAEKDVKNKDPDDARQLKKEEEAAAANAKVTGQGDGNSYSIRSFVAAYNAWQKTTVDSHYQSDCNTIEVKFDKAILDAQNKEGGKIVQSEVQSAKQVGDKNPTNEKDAKDAARANTGKASAQPKFEVGKFSINGGTNVVEVINMMMKNSLYIRKQMLDPTKDAESNAQAAKKPVQWWKIIPQIELKKFCTRTGKWNFHIIYHVVSYTVFNRAHPNAPKEMPTGWHKEYHYIYTGQNSDIIDFALEFDTLFYTAVTINRGKVQSTAGPQKSADQDDKLKQTEDFTGYGDKEQAGAGVTPVRLVNREDSMDQTASGNQRKDSVSGVVASVSESIYANAQGDMLSVRLKIVGDPMFIKQDDVYYNPGQARFQETPYTDTYVKGDKNMIAMDGGEVHCLITFRTPTDIDEETGTVRYDGVTRESSFSGIYRVLSVENTLAGGKFEQTLEMIRLQDQPDYDRRTTKASTERDPVHNSNQTIVEDQTEEGLYPPVDSGYDETDLSGGLVDNSGNTGAQLNDTETQGDDRDTGSDPVNTNEADSNENADPDQDGLANVASDENTPTTDINDANNTSPEPENTAGPATNPNAVPEAQLSAFRSEVDRAKTALSNQTSIGDDLEERYESTKEQIAQFESSLSRGIGTPEQRQALEARVRKLYDQMNDLQDELSAARNAERPLRADVIDAESKLKQALAGNQQ
jgi:hypothetical protein